MNRMAPWLGLVAGLLLATPAAADPDLLLSQTRLVLEGSDLEGELTVANTGTETLVFDARMVERSMDAYGNLYPSEISRPPWAAAPYVRFAPHQFTLEPGQLQVIRFLQGPRVPEGELRSHLQISAAAAERTFRITVPVIVRRGHVQSRVRLQAARPQLAPDGLWHSELMLEREGTASIFGDVEYWLNCPDQARVKLATRRGVAVYAQNAERKFSFSFAIPSSATAGCLVNALFRNREPVPTFAGAATTAVL